MTPDELRAVCDEVGKNDLAEMLGWTVRTLDRKLSGQHKITKADVVAIDAVRFAVRLAGGPRPIPSRPA